MKRAIYCAIRMSLCNFRCDYCYLSHRPISFEGKQVNWRYSPDHIRRALSLERLGGVCYFNLCADGETLLASGIENYVKAILAEGHYVEIVTNMSNRARLDSLLETLSADEISRLSFKCSFHYLELKKRGLLDVFSDNVNKVWQLGGSATVELVGADIYLPFIDEIKSFCEERFGSLPHVTIARNDADQRKLLTSLPEEEYYQIWGSFSSTFFEFKKAIFGVKRNEFCYAGSWSMYLDLETGESSQCYISNFTQNIFEDISRPISWTPICKCRDYHCYNGHSFLCVGLIPSLKTPKYGTEMRNRVNKNTGLNWYNDKALLFYDGKLNQLNPELGAAKKAFFRIKNLIKRLAMKVRKP